MNNAPRDDATSATPDRPTATRLPRRFRLGTQLAASIALSVATVIGGLTIAGMRLAERQLDADLREAARLTAVALADDIELREEPLAPEALVPVLRDFMNAAVDLSAISVFRVEQGRPVPIVSTSVVMSPPNELVRQALATRSPAWTDAVPHTAIIAVPILRGDELDGAVTVAVSLTTVEQLRRTAGLIAIGGAIFGAAAITLLIHLRARRLILEPLAEIRRVIARAHDRDLTARATLNRNNELKEVADGLNAMLAELDSLNKSLNQRVAAATEELRDAQRAAGALLRERAAAARDRRARRAARGGWPDDGECGAPDRNAVEPGVWPRPAAEAVRRRPVAAAAAEHRAGTDRARHIRRAGSARTGTAANRSPFGQRRRDSRPPRRDAACPPVRGRRDARTDTSPLICRKSSPTKRSSSSRSSTS